jgi:hypothetical protein
MTDELDMTEEELDEFFEQAHAFRKGERKEYPEPLNKPLYVNPGIWGDDEPDSENVHKPPTKARTKYRQWIAEKFLMRWRLLFWMYNIDAAKTAGTSQWRELAGKLARHHVPGLQATNIPPQHAKPAKRPGRPPRKDATADLLARMRAKEVHARMQNKKFSARAELGNLLKNKEFRDRWRAAGREMTLGAVQQEYLRATKKDKAFGAGVAAFMAANGLPALLRNSDED